MDKGKKDTEITEDEIKDDVQEDKKTEQTQPKEDIKPDNSDDDTTDTPPAKPDKSNPKYEEDLAELHKKLKEAMDYKSKYEESVKYKEQYENAQEELKGNEQALKQIAEDRIEQLPEEYRDLVPEGTVQDQLEWLRKADSSGIFKEKEAKSIGSSSRTNDRSDKEEKQENLTPIQKLTSGFGDYYKRG